MKFAFTLRPLEPVILPKYKGSSFRGGFGHAFKRIVCGARERVCNDCMLQQKCVYSYIFETPMPDNTEVLRRYEKVPQPFIIEPPLEPKRVYKPDETLVFHLILIGRAIEYLSYFIYGFEELGRMGIGKGKGRYVVEEVSYSGKGEKEIVYRQKEKMVHPGYRQPGIIDLLQQEPEQVRTTVRTLTLDFLTPTRMVFAEDLVVEPDFHHIIRSLLRRLSMLSYFHYGEKLEVDFKDLIQRAMEVNTVRRNTRWHDWERYSQRQGLRMKMGGFVGHVAFEGELDDFIPFIRVGEIFHAGKNTSFGLGMYRVVSAGGGNP